MNTRTESTIELDGAQGEGGGQILCTALSLAMLQGRPMRLRNIRAGRKVFEPGAGGEHKIPRGFEPTAVHSAHHFFDARLDKAIRDFLRREKAHLAPAVAEAEKLAGLKPWPLDPRSAS